MPRHFEANTKSRLPKPTICKFDEIQLGERIRSDLGDIDTLADSIRDNGLICPLLVRWPDKVLIAGGRRYAAIQKLQWDEVPVYYRNEVTDAQLRLLELEENVRRKEMTWKEKCKSISEAHKLYSLESHKEGQKWTRANTGDMLGVSQGNVQYCITIADLLDKGDESIEACDSLRDALRLILKRREDEAIKLLTKSSISLAVVAKHPNIGVERTPALDKRKAQYDLNHASIASDSEPDEEFELDNCLDVQLGETHIVEENIDLTHDIRPPTLRIDLSKLLIKGDCLEYMRSNPACCHHIICDPPYAISMDLLEQSNLGMDVSRVRETHHVEQNLQQLSTFCEVAFTAIRDNGFLCMWYDLDHHNFLQTKLTDVGFKVQKWPIVWEKLDPCQNLAAQFNFTKRSEFCMIARKGNATLIEPQATNVVSASLRQSKHLFGDHPFIKPPEVWEFLIEAISHSGQIIFDPFAGVGSSLYSTIRSGRKILACEIDETHYNSLVHSVQLWLRSTLGDVTYV